MTWPSSALESGPTARGMLRQLAVVIYRSASAGGNERVVTSLAEIRVVDSEMNIRNNLSWGNFTAVFLLQCMTTIGATALKLD